MVDQSVEIKSYGTLIHKMVDLEEGQISCKIREGDGPTLMLIPATWHDMSEWDLMAEYLDADLRLILVDLRGRGQSWPIPYDGSIEGFSREIVTVADGLDLDSYYVGGRSLGGMISVQVAGYDPIRVRGAIPIEGWTHWTAKKEAFDDLVENTLTPEEYRLEKVHCDRVKIPYTPEQVWKFSQIWKRWDGYEILRTTEVPILEIWGDRGRPIPSLKALHIPDRENIQVVWVEDASHLMTREAPRELAEAINRFIEGVEG